MNRQDRKKQREKIRKASQRKALFVVALIIIAVLVVVVVKGYQGEKSQDVTSDSPAETAEKEARIDKINIVWDQINSPSSNSKTIGMEVPTGLEVICPTWFSFDMESLNGDLISYADADYVDWAHGNGLEVWALISDNFKSDVSRHVLSDEGKRAHVIKQLLDYADSLNLDGINIDFEMIAEEFAPDYLKFLQELSPQMKEKGLILSVDMYVPRQYNLYYNRTEVGKVVDYLIIMGYDEHYAGSETTGPIASKGYVKQGIEDTLAEVPNEKIILGIPFYTRVWRIEGIDFTSKAYGMVSSYNLFEENGAEFIWDDDKGCYYAEYTGEEDGVEFKNIVWLEDERSLEEKLKLVEEYNLAGTSGWRLGLEDPNVWGLIDKYLKQK